MASIAAEAKMRLGNLRSRKESWASLWQDLAEVFLPGKAQFTVKRHDGERDSETIFDGTPRLAARDLSAAIDGLIKPKTANWFEPYLDDEDLAEKPTVKSWLEQVRDLMWQVIYAKEARFIQRSSEVDDSLVVFGWGMLWIAENRNRDGILFRSFHIKDVHIDEDADGVVDTIAVEEELTARQAIKRFGRDAVHKNILDAADERRGGSPTFPFAQLVLPNEDRLSDMLGPVGMAYKSLTLDVKHEQIMAVGGYHEFPAAVPRWETMPGMVYPRSPGMVALADALTLQSIAKTLLVGGERAADPPLMVPSDAFLSPVRTFPGGISVFDVQAITDAGLSNPVFPLPTSSQLPVGRDMQNDYRGQVQMAFYKNVLNLPVEGVRTATEVLERKEEFIRTLGPIFGRLEADYIGATVERVFAIMERAGALPPRPKEIEGLPIIFRYQSPIQQARKAIDVAGLSRALEVTAGLATAQPWILDNIDGDQVMRDAPSWSGIPSDWLHTEEEVAEKRQADQQAQEEMSTVESAKPIADSIKAVAQAQNLAAETEAGASGLPV